MLDNIALITFTLVGRMLASVLRLLHRESRAVLHHYILICRQRILNYQKIEIFDTFRLNIVHKMPGLSMILFPSSLPPPPGFSITCS